MKPPAIIANNISVRSDEGPVYGPISFQIAATGLTVLAGRSGSGHTALALTLAGRMKPSSGHLTVLGETKPSKIRPKVALAGVFSIDALDRNVRLRTVLSEHRAWSTPWLGWTKRVDQAYCEQLCRSVFGRREIPPINAYISELTPLDRLLVRIGLALHPANGGNIGMLIMDDLEQVREDEDREILVGALAALAETMPVVVNAVNPLPGYAKEFL